MKLALDKRDVTLGSVDASVTGVFQRAEKDDAFPRTLAREDAATDGLLKAAWDRREIRGRKKEITVVHRPDGKGRIVIIGLGPRTAATHETARRAAAEAVRALKGKGARTVGFRLASFVAESVASEAAFEALLEGAALGGYEFLRYKTKTDGGVEEATVFLGEEHAREEAGLKRRLERTVHLTETVVWTRDIANLPADTASPARLADEAVRLGKDIDLKVQVFDEKKLAELKCGGLLAVGGGSSTHPPRMVLIEYAGAGRTGKTICIVGKGITFDSGGISIKPAASMSEMKYDKSGAVAVLGILRAAALRKVAPRVIGILCCAENVPSGSSYRPGDVVRAYDGHTMEILNTDAEGRVVLSDGLGYAVDKYHPDEIIDLATLTGAQVVALGDDTAGLVSNDDKLANGLLEASARSGEPVWRMPLTDYHRELVKSDVADVRNSTELPVAGMLTGAAFLETFVGTTPWAHLDIAGASWTTPSTRKWQPAYQNPGATAFGVRTVVGYLEGR
ncbi:MAG: leucyl aminopeptidase [Thermoplasmata archaeon]|nr:leucyl aminopeptidase [Thermoplasmata archaeon]MCI4361574.1 leucyl aminopeptidase [Thermoplasmata archaeon]